MSRSRAVLRCTHPLGLGLENVEEFPQCRSPSLRSSLSASDSALFQGQSGNPTSPNCGAAHQGPKPCSFQLSNPALHRGCGNKRKPCDPLLGNPTDIPALPVRAEATIAVVAHLDEALSLHSAVFTVLLEAHASCNYPDTLVPLQSLLAQSRLYQGLCKATRPWPQDAQGTHGRNWDPREKKHSQGSAPCASTTVKRSEPQPQGLGFFTAGLHGN